MKILNKTKRITPRGTKRRSNEIKNDNENNVNKPKQKTTWFNIDDYAVCKNFDLARWAINIVMRRNLIQGLLRIQKDQEISKSRMERLSKVIWEQFLSDRKKLLSEEELKKAIKNGIVAYREISVSMSRFKHKIIRTLDRWDISGLHNLLAADKLRENATQEEIQKYEFTPHNPQYIWVNLSADKKTLLKEFERYIELNKKDTDITREKRLQRHIPQDHLKKLPENFNDIYDKKFGDKLYNHFVLPYYDLCLFNKIFYPQKCGINHKLFNKNIAFELSTEQFKYTKNAIAVLIDDTDESYFLEFTEQAKNSLTS